MITFEDLAKNVSVFGSVTLKQARACILVALCPQLGFCQVIPGFRSQTALEARLYSIVHDLRDDPSFQEFKELAGV
jgi:hypothetical protein